MKIWGTRVLARFRLIIKRRALPESELRSSICAFKSVFADQKRSRGQRAFAHGSWLFLLPVLLLGVELTSAAAMTPTQSVQAASTFNETAFDNASKTATWNIYSSLTNPTSGQLAGGADAYLDSTGTLHVSGT